MKKKLRYYFNYVDNCNMCGSDTSSHKILGKRMNRSQGKNPRKKIGITTTVVKCSDCGLIYSNPQPIPFDLQDHYGVQPEAYWDESYFVTNANYFQGVIQRLKTLIEFKKGMKALDIGAGLGKGMIALSGAGFDTYGFEPSHQFHERAISKMGISPEKLALGKIEEVEYPENNFDFISLSTVLEHLYDPANSITKALKWLKPNGIIYIEVPSTNWLVGRLTNIFYRLTMTDYISNLSPMHEPYHLYEFNIKSFHKHAEKYGYEVAHHEYFVCQTYMPKFTDFLLKPYMRLTDQGMQLSVWLRKK